MEGMDVDLDPELMQKFSCLGTTDKDVLISEFQRLLGFQLNPAGSAIGAYYDFESPNISVPSMSFVEDVTIGEGESIPPDTQFIKTWRIQNSGAEAWPPGVCLKYVGGDQFGHVNMVMVRSLEPQEIADVSVQMCSPSRAGMYQGQWRMCTATGLYYGDVIWVILSVEVGGLLGVTQQLSSFETEFNTQPHRKVQGNFNPFCLCWADACTSCAHRHGAAHQPVPSSQCFSCHHTVPFPCPLSPMWCFHSLVKAELLRYEM
uniref:Nbr1 FW domain-containing protein n=1 Tax=Sciurus vulgaris TaxID=55149 RepID=A0A8D2B269_SCIVU